MYSHRVEIKLLNPKLISILPKYGTAGSAGLDLHAAINEPIMLHANTCELVPTGIAIYIEDPSFAGLILPRSGLGQKGLILGNCIGLIDSDYQGELMVSCWNRSNHMIVIKPLMRVAQFIIIPVVSQIDFFKVDQFSIKSHRNIQGFGHTGE